MIKKIISESIQNRIFSLVVVDKSKDMHKYIVDQIIPVAASLNAKYEYIKGAFIVSIRNKTEFESEITVINAEFFDSNRIIGRYYNNVLILNDCKLSVDQLQQIEFRKINYHINEKLGKSPVIIFYEKIKGASISADKLAEQLNKLKLEPESMKITEETKIKDLIPEGYEFEKAVSGSSISPGMQIMIQLWFKKKEVKDFKWYANKYFKDGGNRLSYQIADFDSIPFEFKIGLLKFICNDIGVDLFFVLFRLSYKTYDGSVMPTDEKLDHVCPAEFLNSIFK